MRIKPYAIYHTNVLYSRFWTIPRAEVHDIVPISKGAVRYNGVDADTRGYQCVSACSLAQNSHTGRAGRAACLERRGLDAGVVHDALRSCRAANTQARADVS